LKIILQFAKKKVNLYINPIGSFNIRINPELHKKAAMKSIELGISLNQLVEEAITVWLKQIKGKFQNNNSQNWQSIN
jgi:predicted HicB family RNase H-like nuclease